jgi:hypothetical protein
MRVLALTVSILFLSISSAANAQISWQPNFNLAPAMLQAQVLNPCPNGVCKGQSKSANKQSTTSVKKASAISSPKLKYTPSLDVRKKNLANFVQKSKMVDPDGARNMEQMFASFDIIGEMGKLMAQYGMRVDNLADAYTVYWINAWLGSRGRNDDLPKNQISAIRAQVAEALINTPQLVTATDAQKQEMSEAMLVQAALISSFVDGAKADPTMMTKVKSVVTQGARGMGLDLYTMDLTPQGFVPAKKGSSLDESDMPAMPNDGSTEQAFVARDDVPGNPTPNYMLIAAAGGAGLGGMFLLGKAMGRKN